MLLNNPKFYIFIKKIKEINNQTLKKFKGCAIIYNERIITADNLIEIQKILDKNGYIYSDFDFLTLQDGSVKTIDPFYLMKIRLKQ